jgi:hypothetical protein
LGSGVETEITQEVETGIKLPGVSFSLMEVLFEPDVAWDLPTVREW